MRTFWVACLVVAPALAGCSSTPADVEGKTKPVVQTYRENYQEIYRRVSSTAKLCFAGNASIVAESDLFSDLGYGLTTLSFVHSGTRNFYLSVRIQKDEAGSKITVLSDNPSASELYRNLVLAWAGGDKNCPVT